MKRRLLMAAGLLLGVAAVWLALFSVDLFLVAVVIGLAIRLVLVMEQRDETANDLAAAWFKIAALEKRLRARGDVVDVPMFRHGKGI